jgi:2-phospho-L-lactate transferase/gluconeogenesis factor (CofD/UPF0052 family)
MSQIGEQNEKSFTVYVSEVAKSDGAKVNVLPVSSKPSIFVVTTPSEQESKQWS